MKKKYPEYFFEGSGGEGLLYVYFEDGPYGNAVDDLSGNGAGFFSEDGRLIAVLFDHLIEKNDEQTLKFPKNKSVSVKIKNGKVTDIKNISSKKSNEAA